MTDDFARPVHAVAGDPCTIVIFGAGGDMTKRLMVPALYNLARTGVLPDDLAIIGVDLASGTAASWADSLHAMLASFVGNDRAEFRIDLIDEAVWQRLAARMTYLQGDMTKPELYADVAPPGRSTRRGAMRSSTSPSRAAFSPPSSRTWPTRS